MKRTFLTILSLIISVALVCTACSKDGGSQSGTSTNTVTSEPVQAEDPKSEITPAATTPEPTDEPVADLKPTDEPAPDESGDEILDDSSLEGAEEYFTSFDDIYGVWSSDYVDRALCFYDDGSFGFVYADSEGTPVDGTYAFIDVNYIVLSFNDDSDYEGNMNLYVQDYDTMATDDVESFIRMTESDLSGEEDDYGYVDTEGVITFAWVGTDSASDLTFRMYDEDNALIDTGMVLDTGDESTHLVYYTIEPGVNPTLIEIEGTDIETVNTILQDVDMVIEMTHGTDDETDYYSTSLEYLADCYVRSYTGTWYYSIPINWFGLYLSEAQAG